MPHNEMPKPMAEVDRELLTSTHWGAYEVELTDGKVTDLRPFSDDADPSPIGRGIVDVLDGSTRIKAPMIRKSWLEGGPGTATDQRGADSFVEVTWQEAEKLVAAELNRVRQDFGNQAIFGGSYGWASAGRFHHAQSQLKRFLNTIGGFTKSYNSYSLAAGEVIVNHVIGDFRQHIYNQTSWQSIIENTDLFVAFGGVPLKNGQIGQGGLGRHGQAEAMRAAGQAGVEFVNISPLRSDVAALANTTWLAPRPSTDTALMIALAHTLLVENLHDPAFLARYTTGFERFADYLTGQADGIEKSAEWAAGICDLPAAEIRHLARRMAAGRTMISASWSMTRQDHGEQPFWLAITLAAMLDQIGLPGGGFGMGYSAVNTVGFEMTALSYQAFPQGENPVAAFIPVARIADMLLQPGGAFDYNGQSQTYPDIRLVYWAGGNPFHHHQDLNRLRKAWAKPDTIIVNEWCWNALAKHADIVLPCTTHLERQDIALTNSDPYIVSMDQATAPTGQARDDYAIFSGIAAQMGVAEAFTEGCSAGEWQQWIYDQSQLSAKTAGVDLPDLAQLRAVGWHKIDLPETPHVMLQDFRDDPVAHPLNTPSGLIEIFSATIAGFGYDDCPGHPAWMEPREWLGANDDHPPLHLISNQPAQKLHSQLDHGAVSRAAKIKGLEVVLVHPDDAAARGISDGDVIELFNARGRCFGIAALSHDIRPHVVRLSTGAWFDPAPDPDRPGLCKHSNPNVLTDDHGTSRLAQGPTAHSCLVDIARFTGTLPKITAFDPPEIIKRNM